MTLKQFLSNYDFLIDEGSDAALQVLMKNAYMQLTDEQCKECAQIFKDHLNIDLYQYQYAELEDQVLSVAIPEFKTRKVNLLTLPGFSRILLNNQLGLTLNDLAEIMISNSQQLNKLGCKVHVSGNDIYIQKTIEY